jgi:pimeloyl-ACP methyl ester carboxylesterase
MPGRNGKPGDLAALTVEEEVRSIVADVEAAAVADPLVVVAHSSGGLVVPGVVAALGDRVARIVLNAALVPAEGGRGVDCMQPRHAEGLLAALAAAEAAGDAITLPAVADPEQLRSSYGGDPLSDDDLAFAADPVRCVADTVHHYLQPVHWSVAAGVPVTYVVNDRDRPVRPERQAEMVGHLPTPPTVHHLDTGHVPAITAPEVLARLVVGP